MYLFAVALLIKFVGEVSSVRINFTSCLHPEWRCNGTQDVVYTCSAVTSNDFIIHLKDFYTDHISSVTVQNCRDLRVVLDCPILQKRSRLQQFKIKDCDRLEFISLTRTSLLQTPPEVTIENVREIVSLPKGIFKSPTTTTELKCLGGASHKSIRVVNSKINSIQTGAIYNVSGIKSIEFENVTISDVQTQAIEAMMTGRNTMFNIINSKIENVEYKGITVQSASTTLSFNNFEDIVSQALNITGSNVNIVNNQFGDFCAYGLVIKSAAIDFNDNYIKTLKTNAFQNINCARSKSNRSYFNFNRNNVQTLEPYSLIFGYSNCKLMNVPVNIAQNKLDCTCGNVAYLTSLLNSELNNIILDVAHNNTCIMAPCTLPVEVIKLMKESDMCHLKIDPQVMCLMYNDRHSNIENTTVEDVTEPPPTFYLIRQAQSPAGDASAAMTSIDKDALMKSGQVNTTNRTTINLVFDSGRDFVENLRNTNTTHNRPAEENKMSATRLPASNRCVGINCRNNAVYDKQKALDFYRYVYAQLRSPQISDINKKKT